MVEEQQQAQMDRLASLVGTAFNREGTVRETLRRIIQMDDPSAMRHEAEMLDNFLRDACPNEGMA